MLTSQQMARPGNWFTTILVSKSRADLRLVGESVACTGEGSSRAGRLDAPAQYPWCLVPSVSQSLSTAVLRHSRHQSPLCPRHLRAQGFQPSCSASVPQCLRCLRALVLQCPRSPDAPCIAAFSASEPQCFSALAPSASTSRSRSCSRSPSRSTKRARHSRQTRDISKLKSQMAQVLEYLVRQQALLPAPPPAPPPASAPELTRSPPVVATDVSEQDVVMSEEEQDAISIVLGS
ncbi:UNVERIFIED_CONTAM: hypothetical protein FKN15_063843 [Acipenser sinensis]